MSNTENYFKDVASMNFVETEIYKESLLNQVTSFHVTQNFYVDIMHDLFEGICNYDLCHILNYYINTAHVFSLETLNSKKIDLKNGQMEMGNVLPPITSFNLNENHLKMSAREVMTFVHFLPLYDR